MHLQTFLDSVTCDDIKLPLVISSSSSSDSKSSAYSSLEYLLFFFVPLNTKKPQITSKKLQKITILNHKSGS